jgi:hypothetical protein
MDYQWEGPQLHAAALSHFRPCDVLQMLAFGLSKR